jgi:hypothetical protein
LISHESGEGKVAARVAERAAKEAGERRATLHMGAPFAPRAWDRARLSTLKGSLFKAPSDADLEIAGGLAEFQEQIAIENGMHKYVCC